MSERFVVSQPRPASAMPVVLDLGYLRSRDLPVVGGKAANLGELIGMGMPVPPGFAISTAAYDAVVTTNGLSPLLDQAAATGNGGPARAAFAAAVIPEPVATTIQAAYRAMGGGSVAVRSSATAEDLPGAAFAGQQDTVLGIQDEVALITAVRQCWGSLWSDRAISYRQQRGFAGEKVALAVVVQRMVAADAAGVMFTANPVTGARNQTVIDASTGLGEAIVSGLVTPDHLVLQRGLSGWRVIKQQRGERSIEIRESRSGGVEHVRTEGGEAPAVPISVAKHLARLGAQIAAHFGAPQDIEWAWADGKTFILQSRPITALPAPPSRLPGGRSGGPTEYFQIRPYPLDATTWTPAVTRAIGRMVPLGTSAPSFQDMWHEQDGVVASFNASLSFRPTLDLALLPFRLVGLALLHDPRTWRDDPILQTALARIHELETVDLGQRTWADLLEMTSAALALPMEIVELRRRYFPRTLLAMLGLRLVLALVDRHDSFGALLSGIDNKTLEANRQLEALAAAIRANPDLAATFATHDAASISSALDATAEGRELQQALALFLAQYGHRELASPLLVSQPTWRDDPLAIVGLLKTMSQTDAAPTHQTELWQVARDDILAQPDLQCPQLRAAFLWCLDEARRFPPLREDTHFYLTTPIPVLRRIFAEMGQRLVEAGILERAEDIYHLRLEDLERLRKVWPPPALLQTELRALVAARRARRDALRHVPVLPPMAASTTTPPDNAIAYGAPGSPGVASGPVRLVHGPAEFGRVRPGDIVVAPFTNPAWTPLFARAAAVIVDTGSAVSHAAIVAREYGLPAVMGTRDALTRLHDGQEVTVDGTRGLVFAER
ncbi:MAG: PEP/pyruvate-binding domain-containing protein [Thermomicrobiales bacterium]